MPASVLFIAEQGESASALYRAQIPAKGLRQLGYTVNIASVLVERTNHLLTGLTDSMQYIATPDIVIARRMNGPNGRYISCSQMIRRARKQGQRIFFDLDDDPWNLPEHNPAHGTMTDGELNSWFRDMRMCDGVITSTDALADSVSMNLHVPVMVCRSGIDIEPYVSVRHTGPERSPIRLGWLSQTAFRQRDLAILREPMQELLWGRDDIELWHLGHLADEPESVEKILGVTPVVKKPWVTMDRLPRMLANIDVAVIPMEPTLFNESRSVTTAMALMAAGIPFAASATGEYARLWRQGGGYIVGHGGDWGNALRVLTDPSYVQARQDLRTAGLQIVGTHYSPMSVAKQYDRLFRG